MVFSGSEADTITIATDFARSLTRGDVVVLDGGLGAGKSVFARAVIRTLTGQEDLDVPSPTFTLVQTYDCFIGEIWHFDLYRLKDQNEIFELGWDDALSGGILLIEWGERLGGYLPQKRKDVKFMRHSDGSRQIEICEVGYGD
ncbi:MAG: tRNA (adenosine(37)-N6)-threonylcarbamoyltransferase complex ATPase subunit type 1 TsaE [Alphaproteobacteria bacterium]|nr:tRNA (adenosine(37)-N6)-threonylcarbamoyltransferase complex ATPase subunit type 1 TsaE [Alphaproteobacteria bacterium]MCB9985492.1 tRNA (adenosine(37)-N6)-threonylcarbamoyltransferase complex ATPase subunit type 1 TsaE [Micavibrio sp.]HPQ50200.1 tRNA (adenosine(37)-N6)-threonylcarbamoyltransferase complex ATPase subunit type 1 TsaE [Alphaproteobacteria bacterium]